MKKLFVLVLVVLLAVVVTTASADNKSGLFSYTLKGNGTAVITGFDWNANGNNDIYVPRLIDGYTVTEIGEYAFSSSNAGYSFVDNDAQFTPTIRKNDIGQSVVVILPDTIKIINNKAFFCTKITAITVPSSVELIGNGAFAGCANITQFTVDNNNQVYATIDGVLYNKKDKALVAVPFNKYNKTKEVFSIPEGIKAVNDYAFYGMELCGRDGNTVAVSFPSTLKKIGNYAFAFSEVDWGGKPEAANSPIYDFNLSNVEEIGDYAFLGMEIGYQIKLEFPHIAKIGRYAFSKVNTLRLNLQFVFPETLTEIGEGAFKGLFIYNDVEFDLSKTSITEINEYTFSDMKDSRDLDGFGISLIKFPDCLKQINAHAFENTYFKYHGLLEKYEITVEIPDNVTQIGSNAFSEIYIIGRIVFGQDSKLLEIGDRAFYDAFIWSQEDRLFLPDSLVRIGKEAFFEATGLKTLRIPSSVESIGEKLCNRETTILEVESGSYAALYASENGIPTTSAGGEDTSWLLN